MVEDDGTEEEVTEEYTINDDDKKKISKKETEKEKAPKQDAQKFILAGQATRQTCMSEDIKVIKLKFTSPTPSVLSAPSTTPAVRSVQPASPDAAAPAPFYSQAAAGHQQEPRHRQAAPALPAPQARRRRNKLLIAGDSLLAHHDRDMMKEATKEVQEVQEVKCYASVYSEAPEVKFRRKNFRDIVPAELEDNDFTAVLMQSSSVELTNLKGKGAAPNLLKQTTLVAARNIFDMATAAATFPTVKTVILAEALPRIDEMQEHAGNKELSRLWKEAKPALREKSPSGSTTT